MIKVLFGGAYSQLLKYRKNDFTARDIVYVSAILLMLVYISGILHSLYTSLWNNLGELKEVELITRYGIQSLLVAAPVLFWIVFFLRYNKSKASAFKVLFSAISAIAFSFVIAIILFLIRASDLSYSISGTHMIAH